MFADPRPTDVQHRGEPATSLAGRVAAYGLTEQERALARQLAGGVGLLPSGWWHGATVPDPGPPGGVSSTGLPLVALIR